ncbi:hypothetical protein D3Y57_05855 [Sphingomonas paeninsulae]|uniref:Phage holin family protein n=1 Tax=Sphingomonas paeninsulae TaxID=2319844 RepID=A0A494T8D8_SPHPE|nr:phage holin family protein [Sphingomonas paeninsulae]AYJ85587.1 hypothetical protein D3Y57_05855 [Sphingomonas paeninsulae]
MPGETSDNSTAAAVSDAPRPSLGALFARLIQEGEAFIRAEVLLYRAQATRKAFSAGLIVALVCGALMLAQALIVAVLIGIILTIAPSVGMGRSVLIVAAVTLVLIAVCGFVARSKISALLKPEDAP